MTLPTTENKWPSLPSTCALHGLLPLFADGYQLQKYSALWTNPSETPAKALYSPSPRSQLRSCQNFSCYSLSFLFLRGNSNFPDGDLSSEAKYVPMRFWFHDDCQNLGRVFHIIGNEHIILLMIHVETLSYVTRWVGQNKAQLSSQVLSNTKLKLLRQNFWSLHRTKRQWRKRIEKFSDYSPLLFDQSRRRDRLTIMQDIIFFHLLSYCTGYCFQRNLPVFSFFGVACRYMVPFSSDVDRFILILDVFIQLQRTAAA